MQDAAVLGSKQYFSLFQEQPDLSAHHDADIDCLSGVQVEPAVRRKIDEAKHDAGGWGLDRPNIAPRRHEGVRRIVFQYLDVGAPGALIEALANGIEFVERCMADLDCHRSPFVIDSNDHSLRWCDAHRSFTFLSSMYGEAGA
jgi:hypothetical protein